MKKLTPFLLLYPAMFLLTSCGGGQNQQDKLKEQFSAKAGPATLAEAEANWKEYDGIGPIASFELPAEIDQALADKGTEIYNAKCTACHKPDKRFIGPSPKDIFTRRNPSWVMNMILNPDEMVQKDPLAKLLLMEYNGSPMANQNLTEEEARAVLEYFRTL